MCQVSSDFFFPMFGSFICYYYQFFANSRRCGCLKGNVNAPRFSSPDVTFLITSLYFEWGVNNNTSIWMRCVPVISYLRATWKLLFYFEVVSYAGVSHTMPPPSPKELKSTKFSRYTVTLSIYRWIVDKKAKVVFLASDWFIKWREARSTLNDFCESSNLWKEVLNQLIQIRLLTGPSFFCYWSPPCPCCQCVCVWFLLVIYFSSRFQSFVH